MKKLITLAFSIIFTMTAFGQRLEYDKTSNWFFGLNAGATWNTTDVQNKTYAGWGFMLGRSFNYDYGSRISYDLRLRYLRGKWYGQDTDSTNLGNLGADYNGALSQYKDGLGYTVNNFEANVHELGLELAIHFNRFRDRTGWDPYIFGGVNVVWNETYGDLINQDVFLAGDSSTYAYDQIDMNKPAIEFALDDNYETALDGTPSNRFNVNFMPSLGIGIGYDFGPRFQMGLEHKTTFALRDDFDGYVDSEPNWGFLENDVYHYTSAFMRWRFRGAEGRTRPVTPVQPDPNRPITGGGTPPCQLPDVRVTNPLQRTETVQTLNYVYRAEVLFVQSRNDITMRVNGIVTTNFLYNPQTHQLESYLYLQPGNNTIEVSGRNSCGTDTETSTLIFNDCIDPVVYFENVCSSTFTAQVDQSAYTVQAQITNATSIEFTVNGVRSTNFTYNSVTGDFRSNILLNQGQNTIRITAINGCATDTGTSVITYTDCPDPIVNFTNGNNGFVSVSQANFNLNAYIYNVTSQNNITVRLNGSNRTFNFNAGSKLLTASLLLVPGQNTIQITATTSCGTDTETLTVEYAPCVAPNIQLVTPNAQSTTTANGTQLVQASIFNVANLGQIQLFVNGNLQQGGSYNPVTKMFEANVALNSGFNTIQITVLNDCGSDTETISVNYNPCNTPDAQMILPASSGGLTSSPSQLVQAMVFNVSNVSEILTYVNGAVQNGGTYNSANGLYQNTVALTLGVNTIQVVATNGCGSDVQTITITYRQCEAPQITMTSPTTNPFFTNAASMDISAMIGSVTSTSQVQVTVNGVVDASGATYNSASITYSNNVNLNAGNNTIVITATNSCGTVSKQTTVIREVVIVDPQPEDSITICFVHCNNVGEPVTMTIPLSQWPSYQSQGAQLGPCPIVVEPVDLPMTICFGSNGNTPTTVQILTSEWPAYQAMGATQGPCPDPTMNICFNGNQLIIPASQWSVYQGQGATEGPCPIVQQETILICANGTEMTILASEWPAYQIEGATLGPCPTVDPEMVICIEGTQRTILTSQWATYQAQGATQGPCPVDEPMTICTVVNGVRTTLTILTSEWPAYQAQGAMVGPCPSLPDPSMTICMTVNGVPTTMSILTSQWASYQVQGATQGPCPAADPQITICLKETQMTILTSQWATYQAQGATLGPCATPDPDMTICLNGTEQLILTSQWPAYQAQGATQGPCPIQEETIVICVGGNEMIIPVSQWQAYQIEGATLGPCATVDPPMTICLDGTEMTILTSEWSKYQSQGATQGPCPTIDPGMTICFVVNGVRTTLNIETSEWPSYQAQGAMQGPCPSLPDPSMTICANVNGVPTTMTILTSQWPLYQSEGATQGPCPAVDPEITICLEGTTRTILTSQWATYQAQGANLGPCTEDPDMIICLPVNGVRETRTIKTSEWLAYRAQGAIQGECPAPAKMTICMDVNGVPTTMLIEPTEWASYQAQGASLGACSADLSMTICVNGETKSILISEWSLYAGEGATEGPCPVVVQDLVTICFNGNELQVAPSAVGEYIIQGATEGPCPVDPEMTICITLNDVRTTMTIPTSQWSTYQAQGATEGPCAVVSDPLIEICFNGSTKTILTSEWAKFQSKGASLGPCSTDKMTICYNGRTLEIATDDWSRYQTLGATAGACIDTPIDNVIEVGNQGTGNSDTLNGNIERPTNGGGGEDELLFGNRTITICHTPNGSIASQTMQIPLGDWEQYQMQGATLGACTGSLNPAGGGDVNNTGTGNGVGNVPINPNGNNGTQPNGGNMPVVGNGSQAAKDELIRQQKEEAAKIKAAQEEAARKAEAAKQKAAQEAAEKERQIQLQKDEAAKKEAELKEAQEAANAKKEQAAKDAAAKARQEQASKEAAAQKAAQDAAAAKARQEQATKDAAAQKADKEAAALRQAEDAKRKAAQDAAAAKARQEQATKDAKRKAAQDAAAAKARQEQATKDAAAQKAAQEAAARRQAEDAKRKAAQDAAAAKARQEQAARDAEAKRQAAQQAEARRKADAAAAKARQEQAARDAEAKRQAAQQAEARRKADAAAAKARQEKAARDAEAKRQAAQQAEARRKADAAAAKARQEKAAKEAAAKKAAQEAAKRKAAAEAAAKKKAEEQRKAKEREGGR